MDMNLFSNYAKQLIATPKVRGVVILNVNDTETPEGFSPDYQCPNDEYDVDCRQWNAYGTGLMFEDYPFPVITLLNPSVADFLIMECYKKHNTQVLNHWSADSHLCGMQIKDVMDGAKDTPTCIRRSNMQVSLSPQQYCEPLRNKNLFSTLRPMRANESNHVVIITARYDSFSMFDHISPGFGSAVASYVTLFAIMDAIGKVKTQLNSLDTHILFVLFHGEAFEYIGSSRMVYDLAQGQMNFTVDDIKLFIEIGQVGLHKGNRQLFIHKHGPEVNDFVSKLQLAATSSLNLTAVNHTSLPSASLNSFLKARSNISGVFIANHDRSFTNEYYNSMYDKPQFAGLVYPASLNESEKYSYVGELAEHIRNLSTAVAKAVYSYLNGSDNVPPECAADSTTVANMLYCFAINSSCELLNSSYTNSCAGTLNQAVNVQQRYVGVGRGRAADQCNIYMFARFLGDVIDGNWTQKTCENQSLVTQDGYFYYYVRGDIKNTSDSSQRRSGRCIRTMANVSEALSPAFLIENYDWSSHQYSSWTESFWATEATQVKIFLIPSEKQQIQTLVVGIVLLVVSFIVVYFLERKASILFPSAPSVQT